MTEEFREIVNDRRLSPTVKLTHVLAASRKDMPEKANIIRRLITYGADVNHVADDEHGITLLMYACLKCYLDEIQPLLEAGDSVLPKLKTVAQYYLLQNTIRQMTEKKLSHF